MRSSPRGPPGYSYGEELARRRRRAAGRRVRTKTEPKLPTPGGRSSSPAQPIEKRSAIRGIRGVSVCAVSPCCVESPPAALRSGGWLARGVAPLVWPPPIGGAGAAGRGAAPIPCPTRLPRRGCPGRAAGRGRVLPWRHGGAGVVDEERGRSRGGDPRPPHPPLPSLSVLAKSSCPAAVWRRRASRRLLYHGRGCAKKTTSVVYRGTPRMSLFFFFSRSRMSLSRAAGGAPLCH